MSTFVHIAGLRLEIGHHVLQRCAACGMVLADNTNVAMPIEPDGKEPTFPTWPIGELVEVEGNRMSVIPHKDGDQLPGSFCLNHQR